MSHKKRKRTNSDGKDFRDSFLFKFGTKILLTGIVVVVFLTLTSCTIKKPESPTWTTNLTVPLVNRTYPMEELVSKMDQDGIEIDSNSNIVYTITEEIDTVTIDPQHLALDDISVSPFSERLGVVSIDAPAKDSAVVSFDDIAPLALGAGVPVPETTFTVVNTIPPLGAFSTASIDSGSALTVIRNDLGITLDSMTVRLLDAGNGDAVIDTAQTASALPTGESDTLTFRLDGKTVSNTLKVEAVCYTGGGGPFLETSGLEITTVLDFPGDIAVSAATAVTVPELTREFSETVALQSGGETDIIQNASLSQGQLQVTVSNNSSLFATLDIVLPDLKLGAVSFTTQCDIAAGLDTVLTLDLAGYQLQPTDVSLPQMIEIEVQALAHENSTPVDVHHSDSFLVAAQLNSLGFSSVTGIFSNNETAIEPVHQDIDVPEGFEGIELATAVLTLAIENDVNLPGYINFTLNGDNGKTLNVTDSIAPAGLSTAIITTLVDSTVADFLSPVPSTIDITGSASFGDGVFSGTINADDYIFAEVNFIAPMEIRITETALETDIESQDIEQDDIDMITDHVVQANFVYNIINHLPLGTMVNIYLGGDSATLFTDPQLLIDSLEVAAAPVVAGIVNDTVSTGDEMIVLDSVDIKILENDPLYVGCEIILKDSEGFVRLTSLDYLSVIGRFEVEYRFDGEF
ncbi:MAG: hypothetical protein ACOYVF_03920 [Candidatus Zixiibacteriota bacterium]